MGIVVGLVDRDGVRYHAVGTTALREGDPVDERTVFEIGSISKVFTAIALARLAERGELSLEDPIASLLPDGTPTPERDGRPVRLVDLATHTSGLPRLPANLGTSDFRAPYANFSAERLHDALAAQELRSVPGAAYEYSNYGAGLLGHLLAARKNTRYETVIREIITAPLGMADTAITLTPAMRGRLARAHLGRMEVPYWDMRSLAGAGGLRSTASDMVRFLRANMGLVETELTATMKATHEPLHTAGAADMAIGLGWHIRTVGERQIIWHDGGTGGSRSFVGFLRGGELGVVVLSNSNTGVADIGFHLLDPGLPLRGGLLRRQPPPAGEEPAR